MVVILIFSLLIILFLWQYVFSAYEVKSVVKRYGFNGTGKKVEIEVFPVNSFGAKIPFRTIKAEFKVEKGDSLLTADSRILQENKFSFNLTGNPGTIVVKIFTDLSLFPLIEEIEVLPE